MANDITSEHIAGLKLALKYSTKYEDRQWFSFLIRVAERNGKKETVDEVV